MSDKSAFDPAPAHRFFAADCFNRAWDLMDLADRTAAYDLALIDLVHASMWHWSQRPDVTDLSRSIGYWQASRAYVVVGQAENARRYGQLCLDITPADEPFYAGYAHEALARAEFALGNVEAGRRHLERAKELATAVPAEGDREALLKDLANLG
ncbi:hypothetical protein [Planctomyces sp. SH-PL14]|uniref:hypothetical protein n=1 Tax=Planctomyces sp. SH-PL14 TaxID=1632864 RepID=UPI00078B7D8D|nr:hypothetical protein [Planctomyces sp. SH-PL14]AMV20225.1 hypothetical protein VT03_20175 [Planctomyces sp. SH-PL14]